MNSNTFISFTAKQAVQYASGRGSSYPAVLYSYLLDYHQGNRNALMDVGSGPGKVLFDLMPYFKQGIGCDPSESMIQEAKNDAIKRGLSERTRFVVCRGEECATALGECAQEKVDLITCAMSAHWMEMPSFYTAAARALRPGGTLAMWTCTALYVHPSTPNAEAIQEALNDLEDGMLEPYASPGNWLSRQAYETLALPWTIAEPNASYDKPSFVRKDWDREGIPSATPKADGAPGPFIRDEEVALGDLKRALGSASSVIRWREANAEKADTEEDPVILTMKRLKERSGGRERLTLSPSHSLLLMRTI